MSDIVREAIKTLADGEELNEQLVIDSFDEILSGSVDPVLISGFLVALRIKGETPSDIFAAASVMRKHSKKVAAPDDVVDTCGTGGLPFKSLNTSTAAALVIAGAGGRVAKHGNRSVPPKTGSADVLEALGVNLEINEQQFQNCLKNAGVGFMFARSHHSAMRHVAPIRQELGLRTIFNLLGPLTNPANAKNQIIGVFSRDWLIPFAEVLQRLGTRKSWIVHGDDGLDEITVTSATKIVEVTPQEIREFSISPTNFDMPLSQLDELKGGSPQENADAIKELLNGKVSAFRNIVALNAGAGLYLSGNANNHADGVKSALKSIDNGSALNALNALKEQSNKDA
ncbi:anthranilate phosphoribosyltransferase [Hirschia maritima]|uniref:anthranilate phosphoribosyltransferase n=1 Tax=Hirschia maritima TaxID=1121961 RepID=UPI000368FA99|nr:anthranilate phosphoribosyltransferase [Hirschia maritima]